ncbi:M28 family peptidase [Massilia sp. H6]|uniref:M28 family peptidase n=1 Tax=Massilia sp. H6 TaxID=2970464 RepID=UPI002166CFD9|nr:M28 family peptidase [Massilia sp. H6]UVW29029.1 M28 family peptidase [Massilia sp. H6]
MPTTVFSRVQPRTPGLAAIAAACLTLLALAWLAIAPATPPLPPAAAPDVGRMLRHVAVLAAEPRPIATAANARARDYIVEQLRGMGLAPILHRATVKKTTVQFWGGRHVTLGVVRNIVVRLPGNAPQQPSRPSLLLAAHYDTGKATLGAARSGAQVAALLETARALRAGPAHANDIVLLFADGETVGALGAQGFAEQHPWAREVGLAVRFDSAGSAGAPMLVDAAGAGSAVLRGVATAVPGLEGSALAAALARLLPEPLRIGPLARMDAPALLFANTGKRFDARHVLDTPQRLDPAMLAQSHATMLGLARHFGNAPLARGVHYAHSYFALPLVGNVEHSAYLSWALALLSCVLLVRGYRRALAQAGTSVAPLVQGFFGIALILLAARMVLWERREEVIALTQAASHEPALVFAIMGSCLFVGALYLLRWLAGGVAVFLGAMAWIAAVLAGVLLVAPELAYVLAWPLAAALGAFTALQHARGALPRLAIVAAGCVPAAVLLVPALVGTWTTLAPQGLYVPALIIAILVLCFASMLLLVPVGPVAGPALALVFAGCAVLPAPAADAAPAAPERAQVEPNRLVYFKDMNSWRAYWLLPPQQLDSWSRGLFPDLAAPAIHVDVFGWHSPRQWYAIAPRDDRIAFPEARVLKNPALAWTNAKPATRQVEFTLRSQNRAPHVELWAAGTKPLRSTVNGQVLTTSEAGWSMSLYGMEDQLLRFTLDAKAEDLLAIVVEERIPGLPVHLLPPGAPARMPGTGMTISSDVLRFY